MNNALNIIYLLLLTSWALKKPTKFVIGYLLYTTSYFGLVTNDILISNIEIGTFLSNLIPLFCAIKYRKNLKDKASKYVIVVLLAFYVYGITKPIIEGHQNIVMSIISSKHYTFYFFAVYLLVTKELINFNKVFNFIFFTSIYFSILYILNRVGIAIKPVEYIKKDGIQCKYDSFLAMSLLYLHSPICSIKKNKILYTILLLVGIYIGDYFSLLASSIVLLPFMYLLNKNWKRKKNIFFILAYVTVPLIVFFHIFKDTQTYKEITSKQTDAITSRDAHNEFRWQLIEKKHNWGYGFIHKDSHYISLFTRSDNEYMSSLSFIDSGYIDLMGKFGLYGTILFLLIPLYMIWIALRNIKNSFLTVMIIQFFAVNLTWSVFTYEVGITLLVLAYSYILINQKKQIPQSNI